MMLLVDIGLLAWLTWLCRCIGGKAVRAAGLSAGGVADVWLSTSIGLAFLSLFVFVLGVFHMFTAGIVLACMGTASLVCIWTGFAGGVRVSGRSIDAVAQDVGLGAGWRPVILRASLYVRGTCAKVRSVAWAAPFSFAIVAVGALVAFGGACTPEVRGDPIIYHIAEAKLFVVNRGHVEIRSSALTYIPQHQQLLYALGLLLGDDSLSKMFHWLAGVLLLAGVYSTSLQLGGTRCDAMRAAALMVLFPMWIYLATTTYIDLAVGNYVLAGLYCVMVWEPRGRTGPYRNALLSGCFFGAAMAAKYTAAVVGTAPAAALGMVRVLGAFRRRELRLGALGLATVGFLAGTLVLLGPWLARNYVWTGNPVAPSLMRLLGPAGVPETTLAWPDIQTGDPVERWPPTRLLTNYVSMLASLGDYGNYLPPIVLVLGLVALGASAATRRQFFTRPVVLLLGFCALAFVLGVPTGAVRRDSRYVMAHVGILGVLAPFWYARLPMLVPGKERRLRHVGALMLALLAVSCCVNSYLRFCDLRESVIPMVSESSRKLFLGGRLHGYEANVALGTRLAGAEGKVLGAAYPASVNYVLGGMPLTRDLLVQRTDRLTTDLLPGLRRQGVRYLFGSISDEVGRTIESMGDVEGMPLHRIP